MFNIFKNFNCNKRILQLELTIENQQKQMDDLKTIIIELSSQISSLKTELNHLIETKYGKGL